LVDAFYGLHVSFWHWFIYWVVGNLMKIAVVILLLLAGCTTRKAGEAWPYTSVSYGEDDMIYNGVGITW
jgi:hypothetical protein